MKSFKVVVLSSLIGLAGFGCGALMQPTFGQHAGSAENESEDWANCLRVHIQNKLFKRINATDDQRQKLSDLFKTTMDQNREARMQVKSEFTNLIDLFVDSKSSEDQIRAQFEELKSSRDKLAEKRLDAFLRARAMLTPDQLKIVGDRLKLRMENWKGLNSD